MTTAQEVIDRAGSYARIVASPGAAVDATTSADMLIHLAGMLAVWSEKALVEIPPPTALADTINESPGAIQAIVLNLTMDYFQALGKSLDPWVVAEAKDLKSWLGGRKTLLTELSLASDGMPKVSRGRYNINTDS